MTKTRALLLTAVILAAIVLVVVSTSNLYEDGSVRLFYGLITDCAIPAWGCS